MAWLCRDCGHQTDSAPTGKTESEWRCPKCGAPVELESTEVEPPGEESVETVFQPALMMDSILEEIDDETDERESSGTGEPGTETIETDPSALPSPYLQLDLDAYLLILGAAPGQERRPLARAKTSFGRRGADVSLSDPAMSGLHFQIEAFGKRRLNWRRQLTAPPLTGEAGFSAAIERSLPHRT